MRRATMSKQMSSVIARKHQPATDSAWPLAASSARQSAPAGRSAGRRAAVISACT
jgi:hypothetical protein